MKKREKILNHYPNAISFVPHYFMLTMIKQKMVEKINNPFYTERRAYRNNQASLNVKISVTGKIEKSHPILGTPECLHQPNS